jgi:hypothetical protein
VTAGKKGRSAALFIFGQLSDSLLTGYPQPGRTGYRLNYKRFAGKGGRAVNKNWRNGSVTAFHQ